MEKAIEWAGTTLAQNDRAMQAGQASGFTPANSGRGARSWPTDKSEQTPQEGSWIVHLDATRSRECAKDGLEVLRASGVEGFLCERALAEDLSLWVSWTGPFNGRDEAVAVREKLEQQGILLTVGRWSSHGTHV